MTSTLLEVQFPQKMNPRRSNSDETGSRPKPLAFSKSSRSESFSKEEKIIVEQRKRANGDGYSKHRYRIGRLLGKGGFAKVYLCTALDTGKDYAVKVVSKDNLVKARARQKLQAEIRIHRELKHRYVCQYKHYFEDKENCYILLELCQNQSLNEMLKRRKRLTEPEAAYFMKQLVEATRYMHSVNVIHRDLKLGNLFLDADMNIKVGDLGLATRLEDKDEKRKTICGTPNYIAPEIIQGDKAKRGHSFEVDIWSMGVILYTLLVGKPPYESKDVKATYQRILNNDYSFPRHVDISNAAKSLIRSMLQSKPVDRPTLDEVGHHPFLNDGNMPSILPTSVLSLSPVWRMNEHGVLVCNDGKTKSSTSSSRQPFNMHNFNKPRTEPVNIEKVAKTAMAAISGQKSWFTTSSSTSTKSTLHPVTKPATFQVFQETNIDAKTESAEEALIEKTRALSLNRPSSTAASTIVTKAESVVACTESDGHILEKLIDQVDRVINRSSRSAFKNKMVPYSLKPGPSKWVSRYVDYTSKYGLGFLMNDGTSGVYFNDSTKAALEPNGDEFQYIERKKSEQPGKRRGEVVETLYTVNQYPQELKKKVTLLKHFRNYLIQQQEDDDEETSFSEYRPSEFCYVKKWVRTNQTIVFYLSNRTVQIVFYDKSEILLPPEATHLTFLDKHGVRATYNFTPEIVGALPDLEQRLKIAKEILLHLLTGQQRS